LSSFSAGTSEPSYLEQLMQTTEQSSQIEKFQTILPSTGGSWVGSSWWSASEWPTSKWSEWPTTKWPTTEWPTTKFSEIASRTTILLQTALPTVTPVHISTRQPTESQQAPNIQTTSPSMREIVWPTDTKHINAPEIDENYEQNSDADMSIMELQDTVEPWIRTCIDDHPDSKSYITGSPLSHFSTEIRFTYRAEATSENDEFHIELEHAILDTIAVKFLECYSMENHVVNLDTGNSKHSEIVEIKFPHGDSDFHLIPCVPYYKDSRSCIIVSQAMILTSYGPLKEETTFNTLTSLMQNMNADTFVTTSLHGLTYTDYLGPEPEFFIPSSTAFEGNSTGLISIDFSDLNTDMVHYIFLGCIALLLLVPTIVLLLLRHDRKGLTSHRTQHEQQLDEGRRYHNPHIL